MAPLGHINLSKLDLASSSLSLGFVLDEGLLKLITMICVEEAVARWLLTACYLKSTELDTTAHKVSAREKRNDLWPWRDLTGSAESSSSATMDCILQAPLHHLHHCLINCYNLDIFIVFPCSSLLSLTPSWPRFIALFAPTLFPLLAQSVDSQSISTLFLIGADAIKIIAVYEKQFCLEKM